MCKPTDTQQRNEPTHVVVAGAGPAGVLSAINFLRRNKSSSSGVNYRVTLIDANQDYGKLSAEGLKKHRSWMIGLASHGLDAIRNVPGLYEDYIASVGIKLESASIHIGTKEIKQTIDDPSKQEGYIVDRNYIVATMARYLNDNYLSDSSFTSMYNTKILYVDTESRRLRVRYEDDSEEYISYDLLMGCDGIRSIVRNAMTLKHRDFSFSVSDIFTKFKAVHIAKPRSVDASSMHLLPGCLPEMVGIALPETGDMLNVSIGVYNNKTVPKEMTSDDPQVIAEYMKKNFKAFELVDYEDFAKQWIDQNWSTTGQVHCNFYHSSELNIVLMGDAAHATSPSIGMGMNTALSDAHWFDNILNEEKDNIDTALPAYSKERVKEGNSLTNLAFYLYSMSERQALKYVILGVIRTKLSKWCPKGWVLEDPQALIGRKGVKLSDVYNMATKLGYMDELRSTNDRMVREHFEKETGMVRDERKSSVRRIVGTVALVSVPVFIGMYFASSS